MFPTKGLSLSPLWYGIALHSSHLTHSLSLSLSLFVFLYNNRDFRFQLSTLSLSLSDFKKENGILEEYQLAPEGVHQARSAGESFLKATTPYSLHFGFLLARFSSELSSSMQELKEKGIGLENVRICYSPFARTTHTANVVASVLNIPFQGPQCKVRGKSTDFNLFQRSYCCYFCLSASQVVPDIRERYFGPSFELKSHDKVCNQHGCISN